MTYLIFLPRLVKKQQLEEKKTNIGGIPLRKVRYTYDQQQFRPSNFKNKDPEIKFELFARPQVDANNLIVFEHMKQIGRDAGVFGEYMKGAPFMIPTPRLLDHGVQMIDLIQMDYRDTKGDLYEYLQSKIFPVGTNG